jgi:hypothetical protein
MVERWRGLRQVRLDGETAFRDGRYGEACAALKQALGAGVGDEARDWPRLLLVAARDPACLAGGEGEALAAWAEGREGWTDALGEWNAAHGLYVDPARLSPASRLSVLMRGDEAGPVVEAAAALLKADPRDARACGIVVQADLDRGQLEAALARCPEVKTPSLLRLRAAALDEAGRVEEAVAAYDAAGFTLHAAALLYQERSDRDVDVAARLEEPVPPALLHRGWWDVLRGRPPRVAGLDESHEATMLRALAGDPDSTAALPQLPGEEAAVLYARLTGDPAPIEALLAADPHREVYWRARFGVLLDQGLPTASAIEAFSSLDADHIRLRGEPGRREAPWAAVVPWRWSALVDRLPGLAAAGRDPVGDAWRAAAPLDEPARSQALSALQIAHPELRGLARVRAGGSILDGPPSIR